ncbi:MAG: response regulator transcription factor [Bifidobacterium sp.]|jgi:DNA-binding NarL/FixJ family response regulator|nr:response regulator transcription factor [Bifidobacterium sp.]
MTVPDTIRRHELRIGVLDNDCLALECIVSMLVHLNNLDGRRLDIWSSGNPAKAIQECRFGANLTDVMIIDMALNGLTGSQVAKEIRKHAPGVGVIGITSYQPELYVKDMQAAGAQALLDKSTLKSTLSDAIDAVCRGLQFPEGSGFAAVHEETPASFDVAPLRMHLTSTEQQIITLSLTRKSTKEIATELNISADTVFSHRRNIKNKFRSSTWYDALDRCRELHIV